MSLEAEMSVGGRGVRTVYCTQAFFCAGRKNEGGVKAEGAPKSEIRFIVSFRAVEIKLH
jgi:hypothetical protein